MYTGRSRSRSVRACTGDVWVRSTRWEPAPSSSTKNVSCIWRAGWSGPKLSASKLNHSCSSSGPSAISQPIEVKKSETSSMSAFSGWREPRGRRSAGVVTSTVSSRRMARAASSSSRAVRSASARPIRARAWPRFRPAVALSAGASVPMARFARVSGARSPVWARRASFSSARFAAPAMSASAASTAASIASGSSGESCSDMRAFPVGLAPVYGAGGDASPPGPSAGPPTGGRRATRHPLDVTCPTGGARAIFPACASLTS